MFAYLYMIVLQLEFFNFGIAEGVVPHEGLSFSWLQFFIAQIISSLFTRWDVWLAYSWLCMFNLFAKRTKQAVTLPEPLQKA